MRRPIFHAGSLSHPVTLNSPAPPSAAAQAGPSLEVVLSEVQQPLCQPGTFPKTPEPLLLMGGELQPPPAFSPESSPG